MKNSVLALLILSTSVTALCMENNIVKAVDSDLIIASSCPVPDPVIFTRQVQLGNVPITLNMSGTPGTVIRYGFRQRDCILDYSDTRGTSTVTIPSSGSVIVSLQDRDINLYPNGGNALVYYSATYPNQDPILTSCSLGPGIPNSGDICRGEHYFESVMNQGSIGTHNPYIDVSLYYRDEPANARITLPGSNREFDCNGSCDFTYRNDDYLMLVRPIPESSFSPYLQTCSFPISSSTYTVNIDLSEYSSVGLNTGYESNGGTSYSSCDVRN